MLQSFLKFWLAAAVLLVCERPVFAFVYLGPLNEPYQTVAIGYGLNSVNELGFGDQNDSVDANGTTGIAPKNFGQGYRWNVPVVYYAFDAGFASYFGPLGMAEVDKAFAVFNNLTNVSDINLNSYPLAASRQNFAAAELGLEDIKSTTMGLLMEQLGLGQPERYVWCLHNRFLPTGAACPNYEYQVIQRNFDPMTKNYSSFVNNALYGFTVADLCTENPNPFAPLVADALEYDVDPRTAGNLAVASQRLLLGNYYTGLTRDDVGGLRALYAATNVILESTGVNINQAITDTNNPEILVTQDYVTFLQQALTLQTAALLAAYPGLVIVSNTSFITTTITTNFTAVEVPDPYAPVGTFTINFIPTFTTNVVTEFKRTFANVVINHLYTNGFIGYQSTTVTTAPFAPYGTLQTNLVTSTTIANFTNGDFYILPTTLCGDYVDKITELITVVTNVTPVPINTTGVTNATPVVANVLTYSTNYTLSVVPVQCVPNTVDLREGIEHITFIRQDFDSIIGQSTTWAPETNYYTQVAVTNGQPVIETFRRVVTQPDILFTTEDLANGPAEIPGDFAFVRTFPNFNVTQLGPNQFGPGTIQPQITITFNNVGADFLNAQGAFVGQFQGEPVGVSPDANFSGFFRWGSFDGSTNLPVVYPSSASLADLEAQIFFQITTPSPVLYSLSKPFSVTNTASGGTPFVASSGKPPYLWPTNNITLPAGLTLSSNGVLSGTLVGATTNTPPFLFNIQAQDSGLRVTEATLELMVVP